MESSLIHHAVLVSLTVSTLSTVLATGPGIAAGLVLALKRFRGREILITLLYTTLAFPTVVIGLLVYCALCRNGPLGNLGLLYTQAAIVIGQWVMIVPIIATFTLSAVQRIDPAVLLTARSLGATGWRLHFAVIRESRFGIIAAVIAAFGRAVSEVGVSMILGGNIHGYTRTMTTTIALEHDKGQFSEALWLGALLLGISLGINIVFHGLQREPEDLHAGG
ncbi:ABC transporter permease [bacterium]|nr:ABC transporter permease [candidate division CSSED10-310 bacterium]